MPDAIPSVPTKTQIINLINQSAKGLIQAASLAVQGNQLASEVPVIQEMNKIANRLLVMVTEVHKIRGL